MRVIEKDKLFKYIPKPKNDIESDYYCEIADTITDLPEYIIDDEAEDVQPVKRGHWIEKSEEYYRLWQDSGRSWDDMPYFVTGLKFACSCCFNQYDVNAEGVEEWDFCPKCGAKVKEG